MNEDSAKTQDFLNTVEFMTLAVVQSNGKPWAVPVHVAQRDGWTVYWDSAVSALHSQCIEQSPDVMLSMFRLTDEDVKEFGFYAEAIAQPTSILDDGRMRYRAVIKRAWINDEQHRKREIKLQ